MEQKKKHTILIVDDDPSLIALFRACFVKLECFVLTATSAEMALKICGALRFNLVFTDQEMEPGMNGVQLAAELDRLYPWTVIVLASGNDISGEEAGPAVSRVLRKPVSLEQLKDVLSLIGSKKE